MLFRSAVALVALVALVAACAPRPENPEPTGEAPTLELLAACTTYTACLQSHERAQAYAARCGGCAEGRDVVISVRSRLDNLYSEEHRRAYERAHRR